MTQSLTEKVSWTACLILCETKADETYETDKMQITTGVDSDVETATQRDVQITTVRSIFWKCGKQIVTKGLI
eukprot:4343045-Amphidinium_carterae.2